MVTKTKELYFARREFRYDDEVLEPGQLFEPRRRPNDAVLIGVNYISKVGEYYPHGIEEPIKCVRCAKEFVDDTYKAMHDTKCLPEEVDINSATATIQEAIAIGAQVINVDNPTGSQDKHEQWTESGSTSG